MRWRAIAIGTVALAVAACGAFGSAPVPSDVVPGEAGVEGGTVDSAAPPSCPPIEDLSRDCPSGLLRCDPSSTACDLDSAHDKNHCGECARACEDACDGGTCLPRHLDDVGGPASVDTRAVAADDESATWIINGSVFRNPVDGGGLGGQGTSLVGSPGEIDDVVIDGPTAYVLTPGSISSAPAIGGGMVNTLAEGLAVGLRGRLAFDETRVFFTSALPGGVVGFTNKISAGNNPPPPSLLATGVHLPTDIFAVEGGVVFLAQADDDASNGAISLALIAEQGTAHQKIQSLPRVGGLVASDRGEGFYSLVGRGEIWRFDTTSFTPVRIAIGLASPEHLAIDGATIYFTASDGIYRIAKCGLPATRITSDTHGAPTGLAVHGDFVYWSASGGLWRVNR